MIKTKKYALVSSEEKNNRLMLWLEERKAKNITSISIGQKSSCADYMIVANANSERQARSLADDCLEFCKENNFEFLRMEGYQEGLWVLLDLNDVIIHIFQPSLRELYNLESLWAQTPSNNIIIEEAE